MSGEKEQNTVPPGEEQDQEGLDQQYEDAWDGGADDADPDGEDSPAGKPELPRDDDGASGEDSGKGSQDQGASGEGKDDGGDAPSGKRAESKLFGSPESMEKAVKDSRTEAMRQKARADQHEKKTEELEARLQKYEEAKEAHESGEGSAEDVREAKDNLDKASKSLEQVYEDYPELREPLQSLDKRLAQMESREEQRSKDYEESRKKQELLAEFEKNVRPLVEKEHPDFIEIVDDSEFFRWAEDQSPALRTAALVSDDPRDIVYALTEFKKYRASGEAEGARKNESEQRRKGAEAAQSLRPKSTSPPFARGSEKGKDPEDYDGGWDDDDGDEE